MRTYSSCIWHNFASLKKEYMATFYPSIEKIKKLKVPPTPGEMVLLNFLWKVLDDSYEVDRKSVV